MAIVRVPISKFVDYIQWCYEHKCGYILGAYGQDPKKWAEDSRWFTQYSGEQRKKALFWRAHAPLVMDCNGLAEGCYLKETGVCINARARSNYSSWCSPKGAGKIPAARRVPGAAVFIHNGSYISHVGFLWKPVAAGKPSGDWWVIEARGIMYGVVATKLYSRGWNRWGLMTKYFDYSDVGQSGAQESEFGLRELSCGDAGSDVKALQEALISLGYSCGKWGADGEFGKATRSAVLAFQTANNLAPDGIVGPKTAALLNALLPESGEEPESHAGPETAKPRVNVTAGSVYLRALPSTAGAIRGVAHIGDLLERAGDPVSGWFPVLLDGEVCFLSGKYAKLV